MARNGVTVKVEMVESNIFLAWARDNGIAPDIRYEEPRCLDYFDRIGYSRFWAVPEKHSEQSGFIDHLVLGLGSWSICYLWPRGGRWPVRRTPRNRIDHFKHALWCGEHIPEGTEGAAAFSSEESKQLSNLVLRHVQEGWCVDDDLFVVPAHGRSLVQTDHHGVVHVTCTNEDSLRALIEHMEQKGYSLPTELPDATFKRPEWM